MSYLTREYNKYSCCQDTRIAPLFPPRCSNCATAAAKDKSTNLFIHLVFNGKGEMETNCESSLIFPWRFRVFRKTIKE